MEFAGQNVLVLGAGVSGRSAMHFLAQRGANILAADERSSDAIAGIDDLPSGIETRFGQPFPELTSFDLVIPSPGIPAARWRGRCKRVWGDIELCYRALPIPIIAVTGTNGKSTVVRLMEAMARAAGLRASAAGNLGIPALDLVGQPLDLAILEVSSFQLESVDAFRPRTAVLLNISPDHLDRHGDLAGYLDTKARLFARQGAGDSAILNGDDPLVAAIPLADGVERLEFRLRQPLPAGAWLDGRNAIVRRGGKDQSVPLEGAPPLLHQDDNLLAALLALATLDIDLRAATTALATFEGLAHRCQPVAEIDGVRYVDDSKATNIGAAARSLEAFPGPIVWIAGGRHKGGDLAPLARSASGRVRCALLVGEAAGLLEEALADTIDCERVGDLARAVERAFALADRGDLVLLAPACASFDQFDSFEDRGLRFQEAVKALGASAALPGTRADGSSLEGGRG
ncbi:MAG: UDP-N-acetylmuramoyl-L-alanine--D-glutamate ligase [bacterium]|nr:UDP-N-acetylmuramoyl-L-alanine--D-glutamate ligase [Deltaproteobacteria bacterium]MCP4907225.1 UDP-N-acetylmuramoyl-L-alanine--D-glutamate ligase [bacterium]